MQRKDTEHQDGDDYEEEHEHRPMRCFVVIVNVISPCVPFRKKSV